MAEVGDGADDHGDGRDGEPKSLFGGDGTEPGGGWGGVDGLQTDDGESEGGEDAEVCGGGFEDGSECFGGEHRCAGGWLGRVQFDL